MTLFLNNQGTQSLVRASLEAIIHRVCSSQSYWYILILFIQPWTRELSFLSGFVSDPSFSSPPTKVIAYFHSPFTIVYIMFRRHCSTWCVRSIPTWASVCLLETYNSCVLWLCHFVTLMQSLGGYKAILLGYKFTLHRSWSLLQRNRDLYWPLSIILDPTFASLQASRLWVMPRFWPGYLTRTSRLLRTWLAPDHRIDIQL